jgi:hypothetical protein
VITGTPITMKKSITGQKPKSSKIDFELRKREDIHTKDNIRNNKSAPKSAGSYHRKGMYHRNSKASVIREKKRSFAEEATQKPST